MIGECLRSNSSQKRHSTRYYGMGFVLKHINQAPSWLTLLWETQGVFLRDVSGRFAPPPPLVELRVLFLFVCKSGKYRPPSIIPLVSFWRNYVPISGVGEWLLRPAFRDRWLLPWTKRQLPAHAFFLFWSIVSVISKRAYCDWVIRLRSRRRMTGTAAISQCLH